MTKKELAIARFLHRTAEEARRLAQEVDPTGRLVRFALTLDGLSERAGRVFFAGTGRLWSDVKPSELEAEAPAGWTRTAPGFLPFEERGSS